MTVRTLVASICAVVAAAGALTTPAVAAEPATDPLAEARAGKIRCAEPRPETRRCSLIVTYEFGADGSIVEHQVGGGRGYRLDNGHWVVIDQRVPVWVEADQVCQTIDVELEREVVFRVDGKPVQGELLESMRAAWADGMSDGDVICARWVRDGDQWLTAFTTNGKPEMGQRPWVWADPREGWKVD
jgi:hypothetical protein